MDKRELKNRRTKRKTLTIEADVADSITQKLAQNPHLKEKQLINDLLRKGIQFDVLTPQQTFKVTPFKSKFAYGMTAEKLNSILNEI